MAAGTVTIKVPPAKGNGTWERGPELYDEVRSRFVKHADRSLNNFLAKRKLGTLARGREALTGASSSDRAAAIIRAVEKELSISITFDRKAA